MGRLASTVIQASESIRAHCARARRFEDQVQGFRTLRGVYDICDHVPATRQWTYHRPVRSQAEVRVAELSHSAVRREPRSEKSRAALYRRLEQCCLLPERGEGPITGNPRCMGDSTCRTEPEGSMNRKPEDLGACSCAMGAARCCVELEGPILFDRNMIARRAGKVQPHDE
ncbi:hypothetical protein BV20DRAFT_441768 [Pilatotrama ljubarskyi]|nr:hypothetical protein BV20DRAFT_441768 [Pilatotrama ljubarskyi]